VGASDIPAFTPANLVIDLATPMGCKVELTWLALSPARSFIVAIAEKAAATTGIRVSSCIVTEVEGHGCYQISGLYLHYSRRRGYNRHSGL